MASPAPDTFFGRLDKRAATTLLCVGLDPRAKTAAAAVVECKKLIDATAEYAAAYKPNAAFFEVFGGEGWTALQAIIAHVPAHIPVILDAKRGDIADTAKAYAASAFEHLGAGAITASPYMGYDSIAPFAGYRDRGVFVLCKTSNKGSSDLQELPIAGGAATLFEHVARIAETKWAAANSNVGLVVGATDPAAVARARAAAPSLWFLVPGVGAQGGDLAKSVASGLRADGAGVLINVSRAIAGAADPAKAAKELCDQINAARRTVAARVSPAEAQRAALSAALLASQCARFGTFKLKSGLISPIYLDLRRLVSHPQILGQVAAAYAAALEGITYDRLVGLPYAALPIATAVAMHVNRPLIYPRREAKGYGTKALIEGDYKAGEKVVIIDDLVTTGETKIEAIDKLKAAGLEVVAIVVLIDREMGATKFLGDRGFTFRACVNMTQLLQAWRSANAITEAQAQSVVEFMRTSTSKL